MLLKKVIKKIERKIKRTSSFNQFTKLLFERLGEKYVFLPLGHNQIFIPSKQSTQTHIDLRATFQRENAPQVAIKGKKHSAGHKTNKEALGPLSKVNLMKIYHCISV
jgi:hypothetical protein